jgi:hypothetical protein
MPMGVRGLLATAAIGITGVATVGGSVVTFGVGVITLRDGYVLTAVALVALGVGALIFAVVAMLGGLPFPMAFVGGGVAFISVGAAGVCLGVAFLRVLNLVGAVACIGAGAVFVGLGVVLVRLGGGNLAGGPCQIRARCGGVTRATTVTVGLTGPADANHGTERRVPQGRDPLWQCGSRTEPTLGVAWAVHD